MAVRCTNCGSENQDPGGPLLGYRCGRCGRGPLVRYPTGPKDPEPVVGGALGAALGGAMFGLPGALVGAALGWLIGEEGKNKGKGKRKRKR